MWKFQSRCYTWNVDFYVDRKLAHVLKNPILVILLLILVDIYSVRVAAGCTAGCWRRPWQGVGYKPVVSIDWLTTCWISMLYRSICTVIRAVSTLCTWQVCNYSSFVSHQPTQAKRPKKQKEGITWTEKEEEAEGKNNENKRHSEQEMVVSYGLRNDSDGYLPAAFSTLCVVIWLIFTVCDYDVAFRLSISTDRLDKKLLGQLSRSWGLG